jgi:serine protease Do
MNASFLALGTLSLFLSITAVTSDGQEKKRTRDQLVIEDRDTLSDNGHWIYNDLKKGFAEALRTGKPLLAVHRCIP